MEGVPIIVDEFDAIRKYALLSLDSKLRSQPLDPDPPLFVTSLLFRPAIPSTFIHAEAVMAPVSCTEELFPQSR
jgi:hypothetical protein